MAIDNNLNVTELPFLNVIEPVGFEAYKQDFFNIFHELSSDTTLSEASDEVILLETFAYKLTLRDASFNLRISQLLPTLAAAENLDIACKNFYGTVRLLGESDADFLKRSLYSLQQSNTAGSRWSYYYHTSSVDEHIVDVYAFRSNAGEVTIALFAVYTQEEIKILLDIVNKEPTEEEQILIDAKEQELLSDLLESVKNRLNDDMIRPLNELQVVRYATPINYSIEAVLKTKENIDGDIAKEEAFKRVDEYVKSLKIGTEVKRSKIIALLHSNGVGEVILNSPFENIIVNKTSVAICNEIILSQEVELDE